MIDTLGLRVSVSTSDFQAISKGRDIRVLRNENTVFAKQCRTQFFFHNGNSFGLFVKQFELTPDHFLSLEFSIPKLVYGHNIYLYYPDNILTLLGQLREEINKEYQIVLPELSEWRIQRLDLCYAWKFSTQKKALAVLQAIRPYDYPRKKVVYYDTTTTYLGTSYSPKFYLKHDELLANQAYKKLLKSRPELAKQQFEESVGVFRFEIRIGKQKLDQISKKYDSPLEVADLANIFLLTNILKDHFQKLVRSPEIKLDILPAISKKLETAYSHKKACDLFLFHQVYFGSPKQKKAVLSMLNKSTVNKKLKLLSEARVGVVMAKPPVASLSIPSDLVINKVNAPFVATREQEVVEKSLPIQPNLLLLPKIEVD